jgi:cation:H+ antiporter
MSHWVMAAGGLVLLVAGGEMLVRGSARLAALHGVPPLVVGLTIVAFGTSVPELAVSLLAVRAGSADVAVGNVVGSNIFNVLFILGVSAALVPLVVTRRIVLVEVPVVIGVSLVAWLCAADGRVDALEGAALLIIAVVYTGWLLRGSVAELSLGATPPGPGSGAGTLQSSVTALVGLAILVLGARWLVSGAVAMASRLGVGDAVIGLTVVAAGTSLPEVAASVIATLRGERDIAVGNVLGSNIFNLTVILGTTAAVGGGVEVAAGIVRFDMAVMVAVAVACLPIFFTGHTIARWEGGLFLAFYLAYTIYLVLDATGHAALPRYRDAMLLFVLPLTAVTLAVLAARAALAQRRG